MNIRWGGGSIRLRLDPEELAVLLKERVLEASFPLTAKDRMAWTLRLAGRSSLERGSGVVLSVPAAILEPLSSALSSGAGKRDLAVEMEFGDVRVVLEVDYFRAKGVR